MGTGLTGYRVNIQSIEMNGGSIMGNEKKTTSGEPSYGMAIMKRSDKMQDEILRTRTEPQVTMVECLGCGMVIPATELHSCNLRSRCEELEIERDRLKTDVEYLKVDLKGWKADSRLWYACFMDMMTPSAKMKTEKDEVFARCEELDLQCRVAAIEIDQAWHCYSAAEAERDEARQWARKYRARWIRADQERHDWHLECDEARAQLAEARNKALDEALNIAGSLYAGDSASVRMAITQRIRALIS